MVEEHIQMVMRLLATQFESEKQDKTFDSKITILQHANEIRHIFHRRAIDLKTQVKKTMRRSTLPITEDEMKTLEDKLIQQVNEGIQSVTLNLPIRAKATCWNSILTSAQKEEELFVGKCGECQITHEYPRCQQCRKPRQKSGPCSRCNYTKQQEDPYKGYCGNCFQMHEFPNCVQCQHYRIKPGRCTNCGVVGPDNTEWIYACLGQDEEYERLMTPVLEARKKKIAEETKNFITYKNCPLCRGFFHSAKACLFRTHVKHFNILKARMDLFADENRTTKMVIPDSDSEESDDSDDEVEDEADEDEESEVDECYMIVTGPTEDSDEDMDEDPNSFSAKFKQMIKYDKILTIVTKQKYQERERPKEEEDDEEDDDEQDDYMDVQDEDDQNEDDDSHGEGQRNGGNQEGQEDDQDKDQAGQAEDQDESQTDEDLEEDEQPEEADIVMVLLVKKTDEKQEQPQDNQKNSRPFPDTREFKVFGDHPDETACELSKDSFKSSICKILPDTAEFPEDIFNVEGCIWCGSKGHDVYNCLGYATWLGDMWLGTIEERRVTYPQRQEHIKCMLKAAKGENHSPERPWELYTGLDDGEYLSEKGVKILIKNMRIVNLVPRHLQTTTTIYADLPTAQEMGRMLHLSTNIQPAAQTTVMEELCNQAVAVKEDMLELEVELKRSLSLQMMDLKTEIRKELCAISTMVEEKISSLPHQLVSFREYLSKSLANLHQRSLQSDITLVESFRNLSEAKNADSCMTWRSIICQNDPSYYLRSRWRQLSDRLNYITEYTLRNNLVVPTTGRKHAEELKVVSALIGEVMYQMFYRAGILEKEDLVDMEDFWSFQETVCRTLEMQAISQTRSVISFSRSYTMTSVRRRSSLHTWTVRDKLKST